MKAYCTFVSLIVLVCMTSGVWAVDPPGSHNGLPTLDEGDGRFVVIVQGASSLGDSPGEDLHFSICVDPEGGAVTTATLEQCQEEVLEVLKDMREQGLIRIAEEGKA